ncbi:TPA: P-type DNA transfer ATPase VirB11, partial [Klebsiella aerogenes]
NFARCRAKHHGDNIEDIKPGLSATLESGERCQVIVPPACERDTVSVTIRKPSKIQIPHQGYIDAGFYNRVTNDEKTETHDEELIALYNARNIPLFMEKCVEYGKTLAVAGETGSGKTTFMKMLIQYIPVHLRITTIEDNPEIIFFKHRNYVHLFYPSESSDEKGSVVTPASLLRWNYRMNPDRILLTEVRGAEAWDFLKITGSGHEGSMTSIHAGSAKEAIDGFITRCYENPQCAQLPYTFMLRKVLDSLDVIVSIDLDGDVRRMNDIYFRPAHRNQYFEEMKA